LGSWIDASSIFTSLLIVILFSTGPVIPVSAQTFVGVGCETQVIRDLVSELIITDREMEILSTLNTWNDDCVVTLLELANSDETKVHEAIEKLAQFQSDLQELPANYVEGVVNGDSPVFINLIEPVSDNPLAAGALNFAIQKQNEYCSASLDLKHVKEIFKLSYKAQFFGFDTPENNLDMGSILEDLCLQVEILDFDYPLNTPEGSDSSISIRAAHFIGDSGPFFDPPLMIRGSYSWDLIPHYINLGPLPLDSEGRYTKSILMPVGASRLFGSIDAYHPEIEFVSKSEVFAISSGDPTAPVTKWNLKGDIVLDGLWYPTDTYFDWDLYAEYIDKGSKYENQNLQIYYSKTRLGGDIEAGVNFFFDGKMQVKHYSAHSPASISFFTNTPNIGWYTDESSWSTGGSSLTCRANSAQIDDVHIEFSGWVDEKL